MNVIIRHLLLLSVTAVAAFGGAIYCFATGSLILAAINLVSAAICATSIYYTLDALR